MPEITYTILKGDTELFSIDRKSGTIRTLKQLDRETAARHELIVGTEENMDEGPGATTTVEVFVDVSTMIFRYFCRFLWLIKTVQKKPILWDNVKKYFVMIPS